MSIVIAGIAFQMLTLAVTIWFFAEACRAEINARASIQEANRLLEDAKEKLQTTKALLATGKATCDDVMALLDSRNITFHNN